MSNKDEALKLALEALKLAMPDLHGYWKEKAEEAGLAILEALAEQPAIKQDLTPEQPAQQSKLSDYEPDGMHHNKPQKRPQNCGTGYCSCIECLFEQPAQQEPVACAAPMACSGADKCVFRASKPWVGLTEEEVKHQWEIWRASIPRYAGFAKGIEAKLKEKNA